MKTMDELIELTIINPKGRAMDIERDLQQVADSLIVTTPTVTKSLPRQVEHTCEIFERQFLETADRCWQTADKLQAIVDQLREHSEYCREKAKFLPLEMRASVHAERQCAEFVNFYYPLVNPE